MIARVAEEAAVIVSPNTTIVGWQQNPDNLLWISGNSDRKGQQRLIRSLPGASPVAANATPAW